MTTKKTTWDIILKVIIAVASAIAGECYEFVED